MKNLLILLVVILVFFSCAALGFNLATRFNITAVEETPTQPKPIDANNPHYFVLIQVDTLKDPKPQMINVWFLSLYYLDNLPPTFTFTQIYPSLSNPTRDQAFTSAFSLNEAREPSAEFWKEIQSFEIQSEGYLLIDREGVEHVYAWMSGVQGLDQATLLTLSGPADQQQRMRAGCDVLTRISEQPAGPFDWNQLFPDHLYTNLRMEKALAYWDQAMSSNIPVRCEVFQTP